MIGLGVVVGAVVVLGLVERAAAGARAGEWSDLAWALGFWALTPAVGWIVSPAGEGFSVARCVGYLVVQDCAAYWVHRGLHVWGWGVHRVHHEPRELGVWSTWRIHPVERLCFAGAAAVVVVALGASPWEVAAAGGLSSAVQACAHWRGVRWEWPERAMVVGGRWHKGHHEGGGHYGLCLTVWDSIFGTARVSR